MYRMYPLQLLVLVLVLVLVLLPSSSTSRPTAFCLLLESRDVNMSLNSAVVGSVRVPDVSSAAASAVAFADVAQQDQQQYP